MAACSRTCWELRARGRWITLKLDSNFGRWKNSSASMTNVIALPRLMCGESIRYGTDADPPFREGNGRVGRLLAILMALQTRLSPLDFRGIKGRKRRENFAAVRVGLDRDYGPMERIFRGVIRRTLRIS